MKTANGCARCGAIMPSRFPGHACPACLLETGLGPVDDESENGPRLPSTPLVMDFGDYELLEEIGRGGQGVVFRARQKSLNRTVALKVIGLGPWATEAHLKRFRREAEAAASLEHPGIVPIYEVGERDGSCYFSMQYVEGGQLDEVVRREPLSIRAAIELIVKLAHTVDYAHDRGILHRDIKPGNILLDQNGEPHLTDFGLARLVETESTITRTLEVLGTPSYIAPEQAAGNTAQLTRATDVYGLGAVVYQLLTGSAPFAGGTTFETIRLVLDTAPRRPSLLNSKVDRDLETICLKCLEKCPQQRYSSALELSEDLERWLGHEPIRARRTGLVTCGCKWVRRNPAIAVLILSLTVLAALLGVISWPKRPGPVAQGIAVLPFEIITGDQDSAAFAEGMQDDVLTKLAKVADLKVISRTSVMQYRGERNTRKIGQALMVSHVLEGTVRKANGRVRLNAQLIDAQSDQQVWAEQYDRELNDVFAAQSELAQQIASQLRARISPEEKKALEKIPTSDLQAYQLYLRAKSLSATGIPGDPATNRSWEEAAELLEKAIGRDHDFLLAHALLVEVNLNLYWVAGRVTLAQRYRAEQALQTAERLAPEAGETHLARALFLHYAKRDLDGALEELDLAARLLPNDAGVFQASAKIERRLGRWREALRHFLKASELDPRTPSALLDAVVTLDMLRHYAEADRIAVRAITSLPAAADQFWNLKAEAALEQGNLPAARAALEKISATAGFPDVRFKMLLYEGKSAEAGAFVLGQRHGSIPAEAQYYASAAALAAHASGDLKKEREFLLAERQAYKPFLRDPPDPGVLSSLGVIDAGLGRTDDALRESRNAVQLCPVSSDALEGPAYMMNLAIVYATTANPERAFEQLAFLAKTPNGPTYGALKFDPAWATLRADPRFGQLLAEAARPIQF